jgi:uncharacterized protein (TIGR00255 family)
MTGFGHASLEEGPFNIDVEIRSLNHRFFKLVCDLPRPLSRYETIIERLIRAKVSRGHFTLRIVIERRAEPKGLLSNIQVLRDCYQRLLRIQKALGLKDRPTLQVLLDSVHLVNHGQDSWGHDKRVWDTIRRLILKALRGLTRMRQIEGRHIQRECRSVIQRAERWVKRIESRIPRVILYYQRRLQQRIDSVLAKRGLDASKVDLAKEIAFFAERADVHEEVQRLKSHLTQFKRLLSVRGRAGKRLDFLCQEIAREANTLASKSMDAKLSHYGVEIKVLAEKMRELIENIE